MPFLPSGSCSFVRFGVNATRPRNFNTDHLDSLRLHPGIRSGDAELGWAAGDHVLDADFTEMKQIWPDHLAWDLCVKTDKLPADLMKAYYEVELKALCRDNPSGLPSARQKREAKESARERLEQEAKDGRFVKRSLKNCLWDGLRNEVFFGSTSAADHDRFATLFEKSFGAELDLITAGTLALKLHPEAKDEHLSQFVPYVTPEEAGWCPNDAVPDFLGNEFLLWLWFTGDIDTDTIKLPDDSDLTFMFSGGVKVEDPRSISGRGTLNSDSAVRLPEAKVAVKHGKLPRQAALTFVRHDEQFGLILQAESLAVTSCKLPKPPEDIVEHRARLEHRLQALHDLAETIDLLFAAFLNVRLSPMWPMHLSNIQGWLKRAGQRSAA